MYRILLAVDRDQTRAGRIVEAVLDLPGLGQHVEAIVFHCRSDETEGIPLEQIQSIQFVLEKLNAAEVTATLREGQGDPATAIIDAAEAEDVDAIYIAGRKRSPTGKVLFGSVTQQVTLNTDRPVVVCGREGFDT